MPGVDEEGNEEHRNENGAPLIAMDLRQHRVGLIARSLARAEE